MTVFNIKSALVLLMAGFMLSILPSLSHAISNRERSFRTEKYGTMALKVKDLSNHQTVGECPVYTALTKFTPYPKLEVHMPESSLLDIEPEIAFKAGSARFALEGYGSGVDNVPPFSLHDALPKARIASRHSVINIEFFSLNNASGRLVKRLKIYLARYAKQKLSTDIPFVDLLCLEQVQSNINRSLKTTNILDDYSLRVVGVESPDNAFVYSYNPATNRSGNYPLIESKNSGVVAQPREPLFAIDRTGHVAKAYSSNGNDTKGTYLRLFDPTGGEVFVKPVPKDRQVVDIGNGTPDLVFFSAGKLAVHTWSDFSEATSLFNYQGDIVSEKVLDVGEVVWFEKLFVDDPKDGYYLGGEVWGGSCMVKGTYIDFWGSYGHIRRIPSDNEVSLFSDWSNRPDSITLTPIIKPLPGKQFPWETWIDTEYGFNLSCFEPSILNAVTDKSSNVYVLYKLALSTIVSDANKDWPSPEIYQIQKISSSGELLWQKTVSGRSFDEYFDVSYEFPGLVPVSFNWIKDREIMVLLGKVAGPGKVNRYGKSHYLAIFIDRDGHVKNTQELGYLLPASERFAPNRSDVVTNTDKHQLYFISEKSPEQAVSNEHWLTTLNVQFGAYCN